MSLLLRSSVGSIRYEPGARLGPRRSVDHEFVWVTSGSARWQAQRSPGSAYSEETYLPAGSLLLSRPGRIEMFEWDATGSTMHGWVHFEPTGRDLELCENAPTSRSLLEHPLLGGLCDYLVELSTWPDPMAASRTQRVLELLLDLFAEGPRTGASSGLGSPINRAVVEFVRSTWNKNGLRRLDLGEIAKQTGVSRGHLSREFHREFGRGLAGSLELVRLARAGLLLQRSAATLDVIARQTGFADSAHLSRRFKAVYGVAPGAYRVAVSADALRPIRDSGLLALWEPLTANS